MKTPVILDEIDLSRVLHVLNLSSSSSQPISKPIFIQFHLPIQKLVYKGPY